MDDPRRTYWQRMRPLGDLRCRVLACMSADDPRVPAYFNPPADARVAVCQDRDNLIDHGFTPESFAYPFGSFDAGSEQIVHDCGYNSGRGVAGGTETIPPLDAYATRTPPNPKKGTKLQRIEGYITDAQNNGGGWVQLVFHNVCIKCDAYQITPAHFTALLDWIQGQEANGVTVETTAQVIGGPFNPAVAP